MNIFIMEEKILCEWLFYTLWLLFLLDCILFITIFRKKISIDDRYFQIHLKYGFTNVFFVKLCINIILSVAFLNPIAATSSLGGYIIIYTYVIIRLILNTIKKSH